MDSKYFTVEVYKDFDLDYKDVFTPELLGGDYTSFEDIENEIVALVNMYGRGYRMSLKDYKGRDVVFYNWTDAKGCEENVCASGWKEEILEEFIENHK